MCIEGYPDRNTPTILVYRGGEIRRQYVTLKGLNGVRTSIGGLSFSFLRVLGVWLFTNCVQILKSFSSILEL